MFKTQPGDCRGNWWGVGVTRSTCQGTQVSSLATVGRKPQGQGCKTHEGWNFYRMSKTQRTYSKYSKGHSSTPESKGWHAPAAATRLLPAPHFHLTGPLQPAPSLDCQESGYTTLVWHVAFRAFRECYSSKGTRTDAQSSVISDPSELACPGSGPSPCSTLHSSLHTQPHTGATLSLPLPVSNR